ncbi:MAG TPA: di-heme oxidoredictase family protein [Gemmatimonadaceae bacterium]|jgi:hypothetical protein
MRPAHDCGRAFARPRGSITRGTHRARTRLTVVAGLAAGLAAAGCTDTSRDVPTAPPRDSADALSMAVRTMLGGPLPGLNAAERARFARGAVVFADSFGVTQGIGPLFNGFYCSDCHATPVSGGVGGDIERHATAYRNGVCDPLTAQGGFVIQNQVTPSITALYGMTSVPLPAGRTGVGLRTTPQVFGRGLLEAVPDGELLAIARAERSNPDNIAGTPSMIGRRVGRFGRKANEATLDSFTGGAFINEMGVTNPLHPHEYGYIGSFAIPDSLMSHGLEVDSGRFNDAVAFMRYLAPPPPKPPTRETRAGAFGFRTAGCTGCHVQTLYTGWSPVAALRNQRVNAYSDLLLHDMGSGLADICLNGATPSQFRTEPLMGISERTTYLHDGRAKTIEQAILMHGGQANMSRERFNRLSPAQRAAILAYVGSL